MLTCPRLLLVLLALLVAGCKHDSPAEMEVRPRCCVADPIAHSVSPFDCDNDEDCPVGTVCTPPEDEPRASEPTSLLPACPLPADRSSAKTCRLPATRSGRRQALTEGFRVPAFMLSRAQETPYLGRVAFTWTSQDFQIVHCALFACRPHVQVVGDRRLIGNYDQCVVAQEVFEPGSGVFDLSNPDLAYIPPTPTQRPECAALGPRPVTELAVGCWAYDSTQLVAASPMELINLRTDNIFNYRDTFVEACSAEGEGRACLMEASGRFGICRQGSCSELCVVDADCLPSGAIIGSGTVGIDAGTVDAAADGAPAPSPRGPTCERSTGYVGACVAPPQGGSP